MPKKAKGGGGARRKIQHAAQLRTRELVFADAGQTYGVVTGVLGNRRFQVKDGSGETKIGTARGALRRRDRIGINDLVLFSRREFETNKRTVDILSIYTADEARRLAGYNEIEPGFYTGQASEPTKEDDIVFDENADILSDGEIDNL